jgi:CO/xanthine dehydrogenase Mo-binding subunit
MAEKVKEARRDTVLETATPEALKDIDVAGGGAVARRKAPPPVLKPEARRQTPSVGQRVPRPDSRPHGTGETLFIDDMTLPGMLFAKVKRSEHAHARIISVDTSEAEAIAGVMAVVTGHDVPVNSFGPSFQDQPILADTTVFHMGDGVAAVAAISEQIAEQAVERIKVVYEPLPAVFDPLEAMDENAPKVHDPAPNIYAHKVIKKGDVEQAFAEADLVLENRFSTQMVEHVPIEPHAAIASWDSSERLTIWSSLGRITLGRGDLARTLDLPINRIRVQSTFVGGNFGGKNEITIEPILALLAKKARRPVKGVYTRQDEFISSTTRHPFVMDFKTGVASDGRILGRKVRLVADGGAYCSWSETTLGKAAILSAGPYVIDNLHVDAYAVYTNKTMTGAMRGFGAPQVCFAYESHMDDIASKLGIDPLDIRLLNAFDEGSPSPTGQVLESVAVKSSLLMAADRFGWKEPRQ